ncbi:MAG TPA: hypothetical protein VEB20_05120 [Azospirillaceae bacterium]|nr:hypothetical protein [Azospirillaceae bacterium]
MTEPMAQAPPASEPAPRPATRPADRARHLANGLATLWGDGAPAQAGLYQAAARRTGDAAAAADWAAVRDLLLGDRRPAGPPPGADGGGLSAGEADLLAFFHLTGDGMRVLSREALTARLRLSCPHATLGAVADSLLFRELIRVVGDGRPAGGPLAYALTAKGRAAVPVPDRAILE